MITPLIKNILSNLQTEYALFSKQLELIEISKYLKSLLNQSNSDEKYFYDLFPEFFGFEDQLNKLFNGSMKELLLPRINKYDSVKNILYLDYSLMTIDDYLLVLVKNVTNHFLLKQKIQQQNNEIKILKETIGSFDNKSIQNIWGNSDIIKELKSFINKVAGLENTTILLTGESGTGKTLIARSIHEASKKSKSPFVEINCATIPESLIESEIFGYVKGAFTNAIENKKGLLEEADGGTLFLDEIGELPIAIQPKFLTFLESKRFRSLGSTKENSVDVRIITSTNKDLKKAVQKDEFREDLFYRINVVSLKVPSLAERGEDILILAENFVRLFSVNFGKKIKGLTEAAKKRLMAYSWPGNIRELKNVLERSIIFCDENYIDKNDLLIDDTDLTKIRNSFLIPDEGISLEEIEKQYLLAALKKSQGNQTKAAKYLGLTLDTFRYRIKKHNIS